MIQRTIQQYWIRMNQPCCTVYDNQMNETCDCCEQANRWRNGRSKIELLPTTTHLYILIQTTMTIYSDTYKSKNFKKLVKDFMLNKIEYDEIDTEIRNRFESVMRFRTTITDEQKKAIFNRRFWRVEEFIKEWIKDYYYKHQDEDENLFQILVDDAQQKFNEEYRSFYNQYQR